MAYKDDSRRRSEEVFSNQILMPRLVQSDIRALQKKESLQNTMTSRQDVMMRC